MQLHVYDHHGARVKPGTTYVVKQQLQRPIEYISDLPLYTAAILFGFLYSR